MALAAIKQEGIKRRMARRKKVRRRTQRVRSNSLFSEMVLSQSLKKHLIILCLAAVLLLLIFFVINRTVSRDDKFLKSRLMIFFGVFLGGGLAVGVMVYLVRALLWEEHGASPRNNEVSGVENDQYQA